MKIYNLKLRTFLIKMYDRYRTRRKFRGGQIFVVFVVYPSPRKLIHPKMISYQFCRMMQLYSMRDRSG